MTVADYFDVNTKEDEYLSARNYKKIMERRKKLRERITNRRKQ